MAQNKTMAIKHNMAKKYAIKQMTEDAYDASCATRCVQQAPSVLWNVNYKPYSTIKK